MSSPVLTTQQEAHAEEMARVMFKAIEGDIRQLTRLLASQPDRQVLGQTEFQVRDIVHSIGAKAIRAELDARPKKVIRAQV